MKLYDKIWVPDEKGHFKLQEFYEDHHEYIDCHEGSLGERSNVIVCSLSELEQMWAMAKVGPDYPGVFELFMKSKGVQLINNQLK